MLGYLRQSTASQSRSIGPFVDDTDFKTAETGLTIANTDIKLLVNGGASANKNSGGGTHRANGFYGLTFDATDTATVGELGVTVVVAGALQVCAKFVVVEEAIYDAMYASGAAVISAADIADAVLDEDMTGHQTTGTLGQAIGDPVADTNTIFAAVVTGAAGAHIAADIVAVKADTAAILVDTGTTLDARIPAALVSGRMDASVGAMAANVMTAAAAAADLTTELQSGLATAAALTTIDDFLDTEIAALLVIANKLDTALELDGAVYRLTLNALELAPTGGSAPSAATIADAVWDEATAGHTTGGTFGEQAKTDIDAIKAATDLIAATAMTEAYAANGVAPTMVQALYGIQQMLQMFLISGTSLTVKKLDNATTAFVVTLNSAATPTGAART